MIKVSMKEHGLELDGHANCRNEDGNDLACAAVSALTATLIIGLKDITEDNISYLEASGSAVVEWQHLSDTGKVLVDTWYLGLMAINDQYNCISFT